MMLSDAHRRELLALARESIGSALPVGAYQPFEPRASAFGLMEPGCSFVTLRIGRELRGCCGSIEANRPLAEDVWRAAWAAAFTDPRFPALSEPEWRGVALHVSVLTPPELLIASSEGELIAALQPHVDGLILELGASRATFLPAVWEQLPDPRLFVRQLKLKAGWSAGFWSPQIQIRRYRTESFGEDEPESLS